MSKYLLWHLFAGTRGGLNRLKLMKLLLEQPYNAHQLAELLKMDYKTIRHHLDVLKENNLMSNSGQGYGAVYHPSAYFESQREIFNEIWEKVNKQTRRRK